jgi:hypothetical protein
VWGSWCGHNPQNKKPHETDSARLVLENPSVSIRNFETPKRDLVSQVSRFE